MYSTCIYCNTSLGRNESLEHFPVGKRLAYDGATGRLWVICASCGRWNLSPLETRWEAIEDAERLFRSTKVRVATENIGMAKLRDGTELVRIGKPPRIELATWRYGRALINRYRRKLLSDAPGAALAVGTFVGVFAIPIGMYTAPSYALALGTGVVLNAGLVGSGMINSWKSRRQIIATVLDSAGRPLYLTHRDACEATLIPTQHMFDWRLQIRRNTQVPGGPIARALGVREKLTATETTVSLSGDVAIRALATLLPRVNNMGANKAILSSALDTLNAAPNQQYLLHLASTSQVNKVVEYRPTEKRTFRGHEYRKFEPHTVDGIAQLDALPAHLAFALEMSLHAESERRAMEGELAELERQWQDAETIGKIADDMFR
ncbi:MAG: hypothetical protein ACO1Q7_19055 [Gemmatimonas sp.]